MDGSMFADLYRSLFIFIVVCFLAGGGACFGTGYYVGKHGGCGYHIKIEKEKR